MTEPSKQAGHGQQHPGDQVGGGDHLHPAHRVEQPAEQQRSQEVAGREDGDEAAGLLDPEERGQRVAVGEEEGVVQEGLAHEQGEAEDRPFRVDREHGPGDGRETDGVSLLDGDGLGDLAEFSAVAPDRVLDVLHDPFALVLATVDEQPARALRHIAPDEQDADGQHRTEAEGQPPARSPDRPGSDRAAAA